MKIICEELAWVAQGHVLTLKSDSLGVNLDYQFTLTVRYRDFLLPQAVLGRRVTVLHQGQWVCSGGVSHCAMSGHGPFEYRIQLASPLGCLWQVQNRVFADLSLESLLKCLLGDINIACFWETTVPSVRHFQQWQESDKACFLRLLQRYGIFFTWVWRHHGLQLLISDSLSLMAKKIELLELAPIFDSGMVHGDIGIVIKEYHETAAGKQVTAQTESLQLQPGQYVQLAEETLQLLRVQLTVKQDNSGRYLIKNELVLGQYVTGAKQPESFHLTQARVQAGTHEPMLDEAGCYHVHYDFDNTPSALQQNSTAMPLVQFAGGQESLGWHFPLSGDSSVLCVQLDDTEQAIILGALSTAETGNVITVNNETQHKFLTRQQQSLTLDDSKGEESLLLASDQDLYLQMTNQKEVTGIHCASEQGNMEIDIAGDVNQQVGENSVYRVAKGYELNVSGNVSSIHGSDVTWIAGNTIELSGRKSMQLRTQDSLQLSSQQAMQWLIQKQLICTVEGNSTWQANKGNICIHAHESIEINAEQLQLNCGSSLLEGQAKAITLRANTLRLNSDNIKVKAEASYYLSP